MACKLGHKHNMNLPHHQALQDVRRRIETAAQSAGRKASEITLIAVSKTFGAEDILPVLQAGQKAFGENRVQEAAGKWPALQAIRNRSGAAFDWPPAKQQGGGRGPPV